MNLADAWAWTLVILGGLAFVSFLVWFNTDYDEDAHWDMGRVWGTICVFFLALTVLGGIGLMWFSAATGIYVGAE